MQGAFDEVRSVNTIIYCRDWANTQAFYRTALGLRAVHENEWFIEFQITPGAFLSVADATRSSIDAAGGQGLTITLRVDDADVTHAQLHESGVVVGPLKNHAWGARVFYLRDPENNRIEVWSSDSA